MSADDFFQTWVFKVAWWVKKTYPHITIIMWDDMMRNVSAEKLKGLFMFYPHVDNYIHFVAVNSLYKKNSIIYQTENYDQAS